MLDKTMLNTSPGSRWEAMWARILSGMSQSVSGEVRIFLAGGSMATREVAASIASSEMCVLSTSHPRKMRE